MQQEQQIRTQVMPEYTEKLGKMRPLPGFCFAEIEPEAKEEAGAIVLPESVAVRNRMGYVGKVIAESAITWPEASKTVAGLVGRTCLFSKYSGQYFEWAGMKLIRYRLDLEDVLAVIHQGEWVELLSDGNPSMDTVVADGNVHRCRQCKSRGRGNILLDGNDVCPVCNRTSTGRRHVRSKHVIRRANGPDEVVETDFPLKVSEELNEVLGSPRSKRAKGTVFSYPK